MRLVDFKWAHISLALVGLMWVFPFLHYRHRLPITTFDPEWWSALLGVLALTLLVGRDYWRQPEIPRIALMPAALIAVVLLQWGMGKVAYFDQALLYVLYLLFAALLMLLGARLRDCFGMAKLAQVLAIFLLAGAELSALIGVVQHFRWHTLLDTVITAKITAGVYGNLAQPNHFANYISLGLISLGLLLQQRGLRAVHAVPLVVPLLFVLVLSGSRSSWLYLLMMAGLAWWYARRDAGQRLLLNYSLLLIAGFGVMHLIVQASLMTGVSGGAANPVDGYAPVQRLLDVSSTGGLRLYMWREAGLMFMQSPWLGVGFGQFAWHHFLMLPELQPGNITGLYNNAHNLIFQLAAETGIVGLLAFFVPLGVWFYGLRLKDSPLHQAGSTEPSQRAALDRDLDGAHWWGYAALGVLAIHSLLEYPLWYAFFVAVAAILLGALDQTRYRLELRTVGRLSVAAILLLGLLTLLQLQIGYRKLEQTLAIVPESETDYAALARIRSGLADVHGTPLLLPYAELALSNQIVVNGEHLKEKLALNTRVLHFVSTAAVAYRQALLLAQDGQLEQAKAMVVQALWSYPTNFGNGHKQMVELAEKDPAHFSALLEFALQKAQEYHRAIYRQ